MAALLLILVFLNAMVTGWIAAVVLGLRKTVAHIGNVQREMLANTTRTSDDDSE